MRRLQEGGRHYYLNGVKFIVFGDPTADYVSQMVLSSLQDLQRLKDRSDDSVEILNYERAPFYKVKSYFGKDEIHIYPESKKAGRFIESQREEYEEFEKTEEEYLIAHEVWIMKNAGDIGGHYNSDHPYTNATQVGYLICEGGGWNPPYKFIEPMASEGVRNVIHPLATTEMWNDAKLNGVTVFPFFWNSWKGWWMLDDEFPTPPWVSGSLEDVNKEVLLHTEYTNSAGKIEAIEYIDIPCNLEELVYTYDWYPTGYIHSHEYDPDWRYEECYWSDGGWCYHHSWVILDYRGFCQYRCEYPLYLMITQEGFEYEDTDNSLEIGVTQHTGHNYIYQTVGEYVARDHLAATAPNPTCVESWEIDRQLAYDFMAASDIDWFFSYHIIGYNYIHQQRNDQSYSRIGYDYDWYGYPVIPTWGVARDTNRYAVYYEYEDYMNWVEYDREWANSGEYGCRELVSESTSVVSRYDWEQGILINGKRYILKKVDNDSYEYSVRSASPEHKEELSDGVCLKYFDNGWVVGTIQRFKLSWNAANALSDEEYPGPEMWCIWINADSDDPELHWDQTFPPPIRDYGVIPEDEDQWWGGILGNSTTCHFRIIPDAPDYQDADGNTYILLTAGQFRLLRVTKKTTIKGERKVFKTRTQVE